MVGQSYPSVCRQFHETHLQFSKCLNLIQCLEIFLAGNNTPLAHYTDRRGSGIPINSNPQAGG